MSIVAGVFKRRMDDVRNKAPFPITTRSHQQRIPAGGNMFRQLVEIGLLVAAKRKEHGRARLTDNSAFCDAILGESVHHLRFGFQIQVQRMNH